MTEKLIDNGKARVAWLSRHAPTEEQILALTEGLGAEVEIGSSSHGGKA